MSASERLRECIPDLETAEASGLLAEAWSRMGPVRRELFLRQPSLRTAYATVSGVEPASLPRIPPVERILNGSPHIKLLQALLVEAFDSLDELQLDAVASSEAAADLIGSDGPAP